MYFLKTESSFDAAHFLKDYEGKCSNLHGHRWRVIAEIRGESLREDQQNRGMLVDFGDLKRDLKAICDGMDHALIYEEESLRPETVTALMAEHFHMIALPFRPTAENLARYISERMAERGYDVHRVEVYETPNNCAAYEPD